jgi:hypothetical protein
MSNITARTIRRAQPASSAYFIRDSNLKGFALRVFPSGTIKYIAEVWFKGKSHRKTLGSYPVLSLTDARQREDLLPLVGSVCLPYLPYRGNDIWISKPHC